jgi:hypothetical protein
MYRRFVTRDRLKVEADLRHWALPVEVGVEPAVWDLSIGPVHMSWWRGVYGVPEPVDVDYDPAEPGS